MKLLIKYIFTILGFLMFISFIYINFIRERLPRDIPFNLTEIRFYILIYICCIYIFMIKQILYTHPLQNIIIRNILLYIGLPFIFFDTYIKYSTRIKNHYIKILLNIIPKLETSFEYYITWIYVLQIIPRIILLAIFMVDVFKLHHISIYYYFIILGLLPLIYRYIRYSLDLALEQYIQYLENKYDKIYLFQVYTSEYYEALAEYESSGEYSEILDTVVTPYHEKLVSIREYIQIHYNDMTRPKKDWSYDVTVLAKEEIYTNYRKEHNKVDCDLNHEDTAIIDNDYNMLMPKIIKLNDCLEFEKEVNKKAYISLFKIIIYVGYLICWIYILYKSFHTLKDLSLLLEIIEIVNTYIINSKIWSPLKIIIFLLIMRKFNKN